MARSCGGRAQGRLAAAAVAALLCAFPVAGARAQAQPVVPGLMGPNALPTLPVEDPVVGEELLVQVQGTVQLNDQGTDVAFAPYFRLEIPFLKVVALTFDGTPVEFWRVSPETQAATGAQNASGTTAGDIRFGARFLVIRESGWVPALGVRILTKTTTGKGLADRRFTDAPAYEIDALAARTVLEGDGFVRRLRVMLQLGFFAWQQVTATQDDAVAYGAALQAVLRPGVQLDLQVRGYTGWQGNDSPLVVGLGASYALKPVRFLLAVNRGLTTAAPNWDIRAGVEFYFRIPYLAGPEP